MRSDHRIKGVATFTQSMCSGFGSLRVAGGYGAILFRYLISLVNQASFRDGIGLDQILATPWYWVVLAPAAGGLIVGPLIYFLAREAKGHGVPEVMDNYYKWIRGWL